MTVHPACAAGVHQAGVLLETLGHDVEIGWRSTLDHLWSAAFSSLAITSDAVRPSSIRWVSERFGRPVERGELDDMVFDAAARAATRTDVQVRAAQATIDAAAAPIMT